MNERQTDILVIVAEARRRRRCAGRLAPSARRSSSPRRPTDRRSAYRPGRAARRTSPDRDDGLHGQLPPLPSGVRRYYWNNYPMTEAARANMLLNPGLKATSAASVMSRGKLPRRDPGHARPLPVQRATRHPVVAQAGGRDTDGDRITSVTVRENFTHRRRPSSAPPTSSTPPNWATCSNSLR